MAFRATRSAKSEYNFTNTKYTSDLTRANRISELKGAALVRISLHAKVPASQVWAKEVTELVHLLQFAEMFPIRAENFANAASVCHVRERPYNIYSMNFPKL